MNVISPRNEWKEKTIGRSLPTYLRVVGKVVQCCIRVIIGHSVRYIGNHLDEALSCVCRVAIHYCVVPSSDFSQ